MFISVSVLVAQEDDSAISIANHLAFADSLETAGSFQGAALVYKMIAELYPQSPEYATAVRNLGHLYVNPFNPTRSDSIALFWVRKHLEIPTLVRAERRRSVILASLIRDRRLGVFSKDRRDYLIDSLTSLSRNQELQLRSQGEKINQLTSELYQTDIDLQVLLDYQKESPVSTKAAVVPAKSVKQKPAPKTLAARENPEAITASRHDDELQKVREIDLRAVQRRAKR